MSNNQQQSLARVAPAIFVALWSTGFVVARYATTDAGPLTFLCVRMFIAAGLLWLIATAMRAPRMTRDNWSAATIVGVFMHAIYLGGVFVAIDLGLPSGLSALIAGLHPVATSVAARVFLREQLSRKQIIGVFLGLVGVCAVVIEKLDAADGGVTTGAMIASTTPEAKYCVAVPRNNGISLPNARCTSVPTVSPNIETIIAIIAPVVTPPSAASSFSTTTKHTPTKPRKTPMICLRLSCSRKKTRAATEVATG
ncbi:MAG: DMT family transporter [Acidimicrobiaceae bacterium]